jgi:protease-4
MTQKNSGCLWMLAGFGLCLGFLTVLAIVFIVSSGNMRTVVKPSAPRFEESVVVDAKPQKDNKQDSDAKIAMIFLRGVISSSEPGTVGDTMVDDLKIQLEQAATDEKVRAIVLYIDSPGGEVTASDVIYNAVRKVRDGGYGARTRSPSSSTWARSPPPAVITSPAPATGSWPMTPRSPARSA